MRQEWSTRDPPPAPTRRAGYAPCPVGGDPRHRLRCARCRRRTLSRHARALSGGGPLQLSSAERDHMPTKLNKLSIYISRPELALLQQLDYPCSETVLASAKTTDEGIHLTGSTQDFE